MLLRLLPFALFVLVGVTCARYSGRPEPTISPPRGLKAAAAAHFEAYGQALAKAQRSAIANFYHFNGALIVLNGAPRRRSRSELRERYEGEWSPPAYFAWETLAFDSLAPGQVIVTGGFRWQTTGQPDTARYIYAAVLVATDSGLGIVFEHETLRPRP